MTDPELAPIIIGIIGNVDLQGKDGGVREFLKAIFDRLDEKYSHSPKILLAALATGAGILGAEGGRQRNGWEIVVPLPLPLEPYLQGMDDHTAKLCRGLLENPSHRIRRLALDSLPREFPRRPIASSELARRPGTASPDQAGHDEHVGLFIAERCAILIAVMRADERTDRIGGTTRIVRYRLRGTIDPAARDVMGRSRVLLEPTPLDAPRVGPLWLVDPATVDHRLDPDSLAGVKILLPSDENIPQAQRLQESLRLADRLNEFNLRARRLDQAELGRIATASPSMERPSTMLYGLMHALSAIQTDMNIKLRWSVFSLAALFCIALITFEIQVDLHGRWAIFGYIGALSLGMMIYKFAEARRWQPFAQDYRAVAESLRVQIAWWDCGLVGPRHRVDRFYLRGATGSLGLVRAAIRHMIDAAALLSCREGCASEGTVEGNHEDLNALQTQGIDGATGWIEEQIAYFRDRLSRRRTTVSFISACSWYLLVASLGPEVVAAINAVGGDAVRPLVEDRLRQLQPGIAFAAIVGVILLMFAASSARWLFSRSGWTDRANRVFVEPNLAVSAVAGIIFALSLYDAAAFVGPDRANDTLLIVGGVLVASIAYAMQFIGEKLSLNGEMRGYEDALEVFHRARSALEQIGASGIEDPEKTIRRQTIIEALGEEALKENEGWLRGHRERPLELLPPV